MQNPVGGVVEWDCRCHKRDIIDDISTIAFTIAFICWLIPRMLMKTISDQVDAGEAAPMH